jgi:AraC-like DNA-binding protein
VALKSGYKSLSLFNLMFTRRFGTSPGKWRQKHTNAKNGESEINQKKKARRFAPRRKRRADCPNESAQVPRRF